MKILVLNCGSSSIKYKLFDMTTKEVLAPRTYRRYRVHSEYIGEPGIWRNQVIG